MTVALSTRKNGPYTAAAAQTIFNYTFPIGNASEMTVTRLRDLVETELVLDVDYGVTNVGSDTGTIILTSGSIEGDIITIAGDLPIQRTSNFAGWKSIPDNAINKELDRMTMALQEMRRDTDASIKPTAADVAYDLQGKRISNLAAGELPDDAVTLQQMLDHDVEIGAGDVVGPPVATDGHVVLFDGSGPPGKKIKDGGVSGAALVYAASVQSSVTRNEIETLTIPDETQFIRTSGFSAAGDLGAGLYRRSGTEPSHPGKVQSDNDVWFELVEDVVRPEMFGATSGDTAANRTAFAGVSAYCTARGAALYLDEIYDFGTSAPAVNIGAQLTTARSAAKLTGNVYLGQGPTIIGRLPVAFNNGTINFNYVLGEKAARAFEQREATISGGDLDDDLLASAVDLTGCETSKWPATSSDTWTSEVPTSSLADTIGYNLTNDGNWHVAWVPVTGGCEVSGYISGASFTRGVFIRTTKGFEYLYATPAGSGVFGIKLEGVAPSETAGFDWLGRSTHLSYQAQFIEWTVRAIQGNRYAILANGAEIVLPRSIQAGGEIIAIGFGAFGGLSASAFVTQVTKTKRRHQPGKTAIHVGIVGNSISDPSTHGVWDQAMLEAIDGANGVHVLSKINLAISGYNSLQIYNSMAASALGPANVVAVVAPETNDIQEGASTATTVGNVTSILNQIVSEGRVPVLCIGYPWYSQALASGQGQNTSNYEKGAPTRAAIRRLAASLGVRVLDLQQVAGPIIAQLLATPDTVEPRLRDNIHPTAAFYRILGREIGKAMLAAMSPKMTPELVRKAIPVTGAYNWLQNSWTGTTQPPSYSVTHDRWFRFHGIINAGTKTDGTIVAKLPRAYWPVGTERLSVISDAVTTVTLQVSETTGNVAVFGMGSATYLRLDGVGFALARL